MNFSLNPGETKTCYVAAMFSYIDNQRLASLGFFSNETKPEGFMLKRTKSMFLCEADTAFKAVTAKHPKYIYNINRNPLLRLLNVLPKRIQVWIITKILQ